MIAVDRKEEKPVSNLKLLRTILRLKSLKITHFRFLQRATELHLAVKPYKNGCRCSACGRRGRIVHQTTELRRWEDVAVMGLRIVLWYAPKEVQCPTHGRVQEEIPWAPVYARVTYRLEWRLCALCQIMTQTAAAEILRLPTSTLWRTLDTQGRQAIKGLRWLLSRHSRHRTKGHTRFLHSLRNSNRRIHRAWVLKDEFEHFWSYRYRASAKKFLRRWMTAALRSRIPTMRTFVGTLRTHLVHSMAFIDRPLTNAVGEGLNRLITILKNRASGYRHLDHFADMIYLTVGDLDIPAQIPSQVRTL